MSLSPSVRFGPFELEGNDLRLSTAAGPIPVTHKSLLVLRALLGRPGRLVTKEELVSAVWAGTAISDAALAKRVQELRAALGDDAQQPKYIETVHRRGFRFVGTVTPVSPDRSDLVGRSHALAQIAVEVDAAKRAQRRLVLLCGEAGIGKTRLLDDVLDDVALGGAQIGRGHCIPQGHGQPYLPVLEALGELLAGEDGRTFARGLERVAPSWAAALPELGLGPLAPGGLTQQRMLSELAAALELASRQRLVVIALEDLHWADPSTIALVDLLSRRGAPARLLLVATLRDTALHSEAGALTSFLAGRLGRAGCTQVELSRLGPGEVREYLERRFDGEIASALAASIAERAGGLPLFMTWLANDLLDGRQLVFEAGAWRLSAPAEAVMRALPETLQRAFDLQLSALPAELLAALEVASAIGPSFTPAALAAACGCEPAKAEEMVRRVLAASFLLIRAGSAMEHAFALGHELVRESLYARLGAARRREIHSACARHLAERGGADPAELARHHLAAGESREAAAAHFAAGRNAAARHALREAATHFETCVSLLGDCTDTVEMGTDALLAWGSAVVATRGYARPEVRGIYERACRLTEGRSDPQRRFAAVHGLRSYFVMCGRLREAARFDGELRRAMHESSDPLVAARGHGQIGERLFFVADYDGARRELGRAIELSSAGGRDPLALSTWAEVTVVARGTLAQIELETGLLDTARRRVLETVRELEQRAHPYSLGLAYWFAAIVCASRYEIPQARTHCALLATLAEDYGFTDLAGWCEGLRGYLDTQDGKLAQGVERMRASFAGLEQSGTMIGRGTALVAIASALGRLGQLEAAHVVLEEASQIIERGGELQRLGPLELTRVELLAADLPRSRDLIYETLARFYEHATRQGLTLWRIRALAAAVQVDAAVGGGPPDARKRLGELLELQVEGRDTPDVANALAVLERR